MLAFWTPKLLQKILHFLSSSIRVIEKNIIVNDKKINKSNFYKSKKLFSTFDIEVDKILISKKEPYSRNAHLNTFLDIMMMVLLDIYSFLKWLDMLSSLIVIRQYLLRLMIIDC